MGSSSFALTLQTQETAHSEGTETRFFSSKKTCFLELSLSIYIYIDYFLGKHRNMSPLTVQVFMTDENYNANFYNGSEFTNCNHIYYLYA